METVTTQQNDLQAQIDALASGLLHAGVMALIIAVVAVLLFSLITKSGVHK